MHLTNSKSHHSKDSFHLDQHHAHLGLGSPHDHPGGPGGVVVPPGGGFGTPKSPRSCSGHYTYISEFGDAANNAAAAAAMSAAAAAAARNNMSMMSGGVPCSMAPNPHAIYGSGNYYHPSACGLGGGAGGGYIPLNSSSNGTVATASTELSQDGDEVSPSPFHQCHVSSNSPHPGGGGGYENGGGGGGGGGGLGHLLDSTMDRGIQSSLPSLASDLSGASSSLRRGESLTRGQQHQQQQQQYARDYGDYHAPSNDPCHHPGLPPSQYHQPPPPQHPLMQQQHPMYPPHVHSPPLHALHNAGFHSPQLNAHHPHPPHGGPSPMSHHHPHVMGGPAGLPPPHPHHPPAHNFGMTAVSGSSVLNPHPAPAPAHPPAHVANHVSDSSRPGSSCSSGSVSSDDREHRVGGGVKNGVSGVPVSGGVTTVSSDDSGTDGCERANPVSGANNNNSMNLVDDVLNGVSPPPQQPPPQTTAPFTTVSPLSSPPPPPPVTSAPESPSSPIKSPGVKTE